MKGRAAHIVITLLVGFGFLTPPALGSDAAPASDAPTPTVIAVIDNGVNAYHRDFRRPDLDGHPSGTIAGYPSAAPSLALSLDVEDFDRAMERDNPVWESIKPDTLYWIPRTKIVGAISIPGTSVVKSEIQLNTSGTRRRPIIDDNWHGTGVASVAAGNFHGACPECLIVMVDALDFTAGMEWVARQPWIDLVSNSYGSIAATPIGGSLAGVPIDGRINEASRQAAVSGKPVLFASGNGLSNARSYTKAAFDRDITYHSPYAGPPWVMAVGAASPANDQPTSWHGVPVDLVAYGNDWPAAIDESHEEMGTFFGTSCSTALAAGVMAAALHGVRSELPTFKAKGAVLVATGSRPSRGPLRDGVLTRQELIDAALAVARWVPLDSSKLAADPFVTPTTDESYLYQGFGLLDRRSVQPLIDVLMGRAPQPTRPEMGDWPERNRAIRSALWGESPP